MTKGLARARLAGYTVAAFLCGLLFAAGLDLTPFSHAQQARGGASKPPVQETKPLADASNAFVSIAEHVTPAVVSIDATSDAREVAARGGRGSPQRTLPPGLEAFEYLMDPAPREPVPQESSGSGFLVSRDGYILTNNHVVTARDRETPADRVTVRLQDGRSFRAKLIGNDPETDVAVLKIEGSNFPTIAFGDDHSARIGEWVVAIGNPLGLDFTVTAGIISAKGRSPNGLPRSNLYAVSDYIQTDAAINPGNSGGPLVNARGEVIGINTAIASGTGFFSGYGFAIPITLARDVMDDLIKYGHIRASQLGVQVAEVREADAGAAGLTTISGVLVNQAADSTPAGRAGIQAGDVVVAIDGQPIDRVSTLQRIVRASEPGTNVRVDVMRYGQKKTFQVRVAERVGAGVRVARGEAIRPARPSSIANSKLGISVEVYQPEAGRRGGGPGSAVRSGLRVVDVDPNGPASGLLDVEAEAPVIVAVLSASGRKEIRTEADFNSVLSRLKAGDYVSLFVESLDPRASGGRVVNLRVGG
jgi:serine protease Do